MKSLVIAGLLSVLMIGRANAQVYYTYPEWDRLSDQARTMYIAGAYDSLVSISSPDTASISRHYSKCVSGRVPIEQLAKMGAAGRLAVIDRHDAFKEAKALKHLFENGI